MAGRSDIRAGSAFVELLLRDSKFTKGLRSASTRLKSWGSGVAAIGGIATAAGAAIVGPLLKAVGHFADVGSELNDMSARTGVAASALAELGYAASQTGSNLGQVEGGLRKMQRLLGEAAGGSKAANESLRDLGLTIEELKGMSPDQQFQAIADKVAAIQDPSARAAAAMKVFGKSGTQLLPMIADLAALRKEMRESGLGPTDEEVKRADALGDSFGKLKAFASGLVFRIGSALADDVMRGVEAVTDIVATVGRWVKENKALVTTVAKVGAAILVAGAAITALGLSIAGAGVVLGGIATGIGVVGSILGAILSPLGLITAALVAGAIYWAKYTESGKSAVASISAGIQSLMGTFSATFGGIKDALAAGDLALAGKIAMAGLNVVWQQGLGMLKAKWSEWKAFVLEVANNASANIASAMINAWHDIQAVWIEAKAFFQTLWEDVASGAVVAWASARQTFLGAGASAALFGGKAAPNAQAQVAARQQRQAEIEAARQADIGNLGKSRAAQQQTLREDLARRNKQIRDNIGGADGGGLAEAQAELDRLTAQASAAAEKKRAEKAKREEAVAAIPETESLGGKVSGSFSGAALMAMGQGGSKSERLLTSLDKRFAEANKISAQVLAAVRLGGAVS